MKTVPSKRMDYLFPHYVIKSVPKVLVAAKKWDTSFHRGSLHLNKIKTERFWHSFGNSWDIPNLWILRCTEGFVCHQALSDCVGNWAQKQSLQRGEDTESPSHIQKPSGHGSEKMTFSGLAWTKVLVQTGLWRSIPTFLLWFFVYYSSEKIITNSFWHYTNFQLAYLYIEYTSVIWSSLHHLPFWLSFGLTLL